MSVNAPLVRVPIDLFLGIFGDSILLYLAIALFESNRSIALIWVGKTVCFTANAFLLDPGAESYWLWVGSWGGDLLACTAYIINSPATNQLTTKTHTRGGCKQ